MRLSYALPQIDILTKKQNSVFLKDLATFQYGGAEFLINDPVRVDVDWLKTQLKTHGIVLSGLRTGSVFIQGGLSFSDPDTGIRRLAVQRMKAIIEMASGFGTCLLLGLIQGRPGDGDSFEEAKKRIRDCLLECADTAEKNGVVLNLEPLNRYELDFNLTVSEVMEFLAPINLSLSAPVKLLMDTYHMVLEEDSVTGAFVRAGEHIGHVHFSDTNRGVPGTGNIDFLEVVKTLRAIGYEGWITVECNDKPDIRSAAAAGAAYIRALFDIVEFGIGLRTRHP